MYEISGVYVVFVLWSRGMYVLLLGMANVLKRLIHLFYVRCLYDVNNTEYAVCAHVVSFVKFWRLMKVVIFVYVTRIPVFSVLLGPHGRRWAERCLNCLVSQLQDTLRQTHYVHSHQWTM